MDKLRILNVIFSIFSIPPKFILSIDYKVYFLIVFSFGACECSFHLIVTVCNATGNASVNLRHAALMSDYKGVTTPGNDHFRGAS